MKLYSKTSFLDLLSVHSILEFIVFSACIVIFGLFYRTQLFPALCCLIFPCIFILNKVTSLQDMIKIFGLTSFNKNNSAFLLSGLLLGAIWALVYRNAMQVTLFPTTITYFALVAGAIGATEEIIFRGYLQGILKKYGPLAATVGASFSHTAYKVSLFIIPSGQFEVDLYSLATLTFIVGLMFGVLREFSKSVVPCVLAHAIFDILVYSHKWYTPWWIW